MKRIFLILLLLVPSVVQAQRTIFGNDTTTSYVAFSMNDDIYGVSWYYTLTDQDEYDSLYAYIRFVFTGAATCSVKGLVLLSDGDSLQEKGLVVEQCTETRYIVSAGSETVGPAWYGFSFPTPPALTINKYYTVAVMGGGGGQFQAYYITHPQNPTEAWKYSQNTEADLACEDKTVNSLTSYSMSIYVSRNAAVTSGQVIIIGSTNEAIFDNRVGYCALPRFRYMGQPTRE